MTFRTRKLLVTGLMLIIALLIILPFYIMIVMGSYSTNELFRGLKLTFGSQMKENLDTVFKNNFQLFYFNSFYIACVVSVSAVIISAMSGYVFAKYTFRGKQLLFNAALSTMMIPPQLGLIAFVWQINKMGMSNTHLPLIIPSMSSVFGVFWMTQYIKTSVPNEIIESARIDGCGELRMFVWMVLPLIRPALISLGLLLFLWSWNSYMVPLIVINKLELYTVPLGIQGLRQMYRVDYGAQIVGLSLGTLPIILLFLVFSKNFISGLTAAAIKG